MTASVIDFRWIDARRAALESQSSANFHRIQPLVPKRCRDRRRVHRRAV